MLILLHNKLTHNKGKEMKASLEWLQDFVDLSGFTPSQIAAKLTMAGLEVEGLGDRFAFLETVIAAEILEVKPIEGTHLSLCQVNTGSASVQVVCGAPNVAAGQVAPLAQPGTELPGGQAIAETKVHGHFSQGMLCSGAELALNQEASGLMLLADACPGQTLKELTKREDWVVEIGITPNRPDGLSIFGLARELAALLERPLKPIATTVPENGPETTTLGTVAIDDPQHCLRFTARIISDVKIGPSPDWLVNRLAAVGLRSISNVVDITNYVMLEMGQPLHAYDLETLAGRKLTARLAPQGVTFTTLDGQDRKLTAEHNLMICDGEKPVGLAGIMGGLNTEIKDHTRHIMLEGACFNATTIRKTSRALGLSTDASYRFERGSDPEICGRAVDRASALMAELAGGTIARGLIDVYPKPFVAPQVPFSPSRCNAYLGTKHQTADMVRVLTGIGLTVSGQGDELSCALPSWRPDLSREVDVWEEVARLLDFESLPATLPKAPVNRQAPPAAWTLKETLRKVLSSQGFAESITYSFINRNFADKLSLAEDSLWRKRILPIINPLSEEQGVMRPLMLPSLLNAVRLNQSHHIPEIALYEVGATFLSNGQEKQPEEILTLGAIWSGQLGGNTWVSKTRPVDFWDIKGLIETLGEALNLTLRFRKGTADELPAYYDPAEAAMIDICHKDVVKPLGHLGRIKAKALKSFGIKEINGPSYAAEITAQTILELGAGSPPPFQNWSKFPPNERDMALLVKRETSAAEILDALKATPNIPLRQVSVFDIYQGDQLPKEQKSLAFRLTFQVDDRTLTDEEVESWFQQLLAAATQKCGATLRT